MRTGLLGIRGLVVVLVAFAAQIHYAGATTTTYNNSAAFAAAIGPSITDGYESDGYKNGDIVTSEILTNSEILQ